MKSDHDLKRIRTAAVATLMTALLSACGGGSDGPKFSLPVTPPAPQPQTLSCDDTMKAAFKPDAATEVVDVKMFKAGEAYPGTTIEQFRGVPAVFIADLCRVKMKVGPGVSGPADAPSTSQGIGIEVWLPAKDKWAQRVVNLGSVGWQGGDELNLAIMSSTANSSDSAFRSAPRVAALESAVTSSTDTGKPLSPTASYTSGSFGLLPDGTLNAKGWENWSVRGLREQAIKVKALAIAYYGSAPKYTYFSGASGGGRQAMQVAQLLADHYDGVAAGVPGQHWSKLTLQQGYGQIVVQRDLNGEPLSDAQRQLLGNSAIQACDLVGGKHLGFILDQKACRYDPTQDPEVLCPSSGGTNNTPACVSTTQARAMNKVWYGITADGSVPDPAVDNGWDAPPSGVRRWYGLPRGAETIQIQGGGSFIPGSMVANTLQDPTMGDTTYKNAKSNGQNGYLKLSYADYARVFDLALEMQPQFFHMNASNPDLSGLKNKGAKLIVSSGAYDEQVIPQGHTSYYDSVTAAMGGTAAVQSFFRLYVLPGAGHGRVFNGSTNPTVPIPVTSDTLFWDLLKDWVEHGKAPPDDMKLVTPQDASRPMSLPLCAYPTLQVYHSGDPFQAGSYRCQ